MKKRGKGGERLPDRDQVIVGVISGGFSQEV